MRGIGAVATLVRLPRATKRVIALAADAMLCVLSVAVAYYLRMDSWNAPVGNQWLSYVAALALALPIFAGFSLYRAIFRYLGNSALVAVGRACLAYAIPYAIIFAAIGVPNVPRTIGLMQPALLFIFVACSRVVARYWLSGEYKQVLRAQQRRRVLIYGAGSAGRQLAAALANSKEMEVVAFADDDPTLHGSMIDRREIYPATNFAGLVDRLAVDDVLLAVPSASRRRRTEIVNDLRGTPAVIRTLPGVAELAQGKVTVSDLRPLDLEDLLGRDAVDPDPGLMGRNITGKIVMVTGAGGSIGSELCRQIVNLHPAKLLLVDVSEVSLYTIHQELTARVEKSRGIGIDHVPLLASVQDAGRIEQIIGAWKPDTIYHAAAYKHVPMVEHNPTEGVRNNVFGTRTVAEAARRHGVANFVLISTDKAVRPTNVMGTTKRLAEMVLQAMATEEAIDGGTTCFSMVRFGNVLGSSGSVVPLFRQQIRNGGPVTITHADVTRYFMTIPEAAQLVIQAGAMARGGEVFVLEMGEPVRIHDLAERMIELSGLTVRNDANPQGDIEIAVVGLRPGEKLYEELLIGNDPKPTTHSRILMANEHMLSMAELRAALDRLETAIDKGNAAGVRQILCDVVTEFQPQSDLVDWVHLRRAMQPAN